MADENASGGPPPLAKAADRLRETTKWLIASFAAIGAALIAGSQLSSIGSLAPGHGWRFIIAGLGVLVALSGVAWAIAAALNVATAGSVNLGDLGTRPAADPLRKRLEGDLVLMAGHGGLAALAVDYGAAVRQRKETYDAYLADPSKLGPAQTAHANAVVMSQTVQNVLEVASFEDVAQAFKNARFHLFGGALAAALGVITFAAAANPPDDEPETTRPAIGTTLNDAATSLTASFDAAGLDPDEGLDVLVTIDPVGRTLYRGSFGPDASGAVKRTVQFPFHAGRSAKSLLLRAWPSNAELPTCVLNGEWEPRDDAACAAIVLPSRKRTQHPGS